MIVTKSEKSLNKHLRASNWHKLGMSNIFGLKWKLHILFKYNFAHSKRWEELVSCNLHSVCFQIKKLIYFLLEFSAPFTVRTITKMELLPPCTLPHFFVKQLSICLFFAHAPPCEVFWCKDKGVKVGNFTLFTKSLYPHHTISRIQF